MQTGLTPTGIDSSTIQLSQGGESGKHKKKKKKKHKHKHKKDKSEKGDRPNIVFKMSKTDYSSEASTSNMNSPMIARTPPSSPE